MHIARTLKDLHLLLLSLPPHHPFSHKIFSTVRSRGKNVHEGPSQPCELKKLPVEKGVSKKEHAIERNSMRVLSLRKV